MHYCTRLLIPPYLSLRCICQPHDPVQELPRCSKEPHFPLVVRTSLLINAGDTRDPGSIPGSGRSPGGGNGNPLQYSCLDNSHGQRSLAGYSPQRHKESDMTEQLSTHTAHRTLSVTGQHNAVVFNSDYRPSKTQNYYEDGLCYWSNSSKKKRRQKEKKKKLLTLFIVSRSHLRKISKIIAFHFQVEHLTFWLCSIGNKVFIQQLLKNDPHSVKNREILLTRC